MVLEEILPVGHKVDFFEPSCLHFLLYLGKLCSCQVVHSRVVVCTDSDRYDVEPVQHLQALEEPQAVSGQAILCYPACEPGFRVGVVGNVNH